MSVAPVYKSERAFLFRSLNPVGVIPSVLRKAVLKTVLELKPHVWENTSEKRTGGPHSKRNAHGPRFYTGHAVLP
jgi:hypothetical protein